MLITTVCAALSAAGLAIAFLTAYRRRFVAALRIAAVSLLPVGLAMAGLIGLAGKIAAALGTWASGLVLRPTVWVGFAVLALAVVLYVIARIANRHRPDRAARKEKRQAARAGSGTPALDAGTQEKSPAVRPSADTAEAHPSPEPSAGTGTGKDSGSEDFSDIEDILKKHGI